MTTRAWKRWAARSAQVSLFLALLGPGSGLAQDSAHCRAIRARAGEEAALLIWPKVMAELHRYPTDAQYAGPTVGGTNYQARVGASISPTELIQGLRVGGAADAECQLHESAQALREQIEGATGDASRLALSAQVAYLAGHRDEWSGLLDRARELLKRGLITVVELEELHRQASQLERMLEAARGEEARLEARARQRPALSLPALRELYLSRALEFEHQSGRARALGDLRVNLSGGVIPSSRRETGWYGLVEISYSLGGPARHGAAARYLEARREELERSPQELAGQAGEARLALQAQAARARAELRIAESELAFLRSTREALERSPASSAEQARAQLGLRLLAVEADRVFLSRLAETLAALAD